MGTAMGATMDDLEVDALPEAGLPVGSLELVALDLFDRSSGSEAVISMSKINGRAKDGIPLELQQCNFQNKGMY